MTHRAAWLRLIPLVAAVALSIAACASPAPPAPTPTSVPSGSPAVTPSPTPTLPPTPSPTSPPTPTALASAQPSPTPAATASPAAGPGAPEFLAITDRYQGHADGSATITTTVTWTKDTTTGTTVKVFGVNKCLNTVPSGDCVTHGMRIPSDTMLLLASAPADLGKVSWQYWEPEGAAYFCGAIGVVADRGVIAPTDQWYYAVLLRALNADGKSNFVIATTTTNDDFTC